MIAKNCKISMIFLLIGVGPVFAQDDEQDVVYETYLEEVIVTAQRREQNIQDVPISISAYSGKFLDKLGIDTLSGVAALAPNFSISRGSQETNTRILIRGIGAAGNNAVEPSVGIFVDSVYYPRPGSVIGRMLDVKSFEVLRGPQGTLFGRNTPVGALNIATNDPGNIPESFIETSYGDYNAWELGGVVNGPLGNEAAGRLAFNYFSRDGYGYNLLDGKDFGARDDLQMRGKVVFDLSDELSLRFSADYADINSENGAIELLNSTDAPAFEFTSLALYGAAPITDDPYDWVINQDHRDRLDDTQWGLSADANYSLSNGLRVRSITAFRKWHADVVESALRIPTNMVPRFTDYQTQTFSQELHLLSAEGETVDWITGLFYYDEKYDINQAFSGGDSYCIPTIAAFLDLENGLACLSFPQDRFVVSDFDQHLKSLAGFGQFTWFINDRWAFTGGGRYTNDKKTGNFLQTVSNPYATLLRAPETVNDMKIDDSNFTWLANVSWYPNDDVMLFATVSTGYKSGGFNSEGSGEPLGPERRVFGPEDSTNYEIGVKSTLFHNTMTANVTLYRLDLNDFQNLGFDGLSFVIVNAGELRQQGVEADITWAPIEPLKIVSGVSYLDSEYLSFPAAPGLPGDPGTQDLKGVRATFSPKWQVSIQADWTGELGANLEWFAGVGWQYMDEQNIGTANNNNPQSIQDSYSLVDARIGIQANSGKWDITLFGNNLSNEGYCLAMFDQPFGAQLNAQNADAGTIVQRCPIGAPRTWYVKARWWFR